MQNLLLLRQWLQKAPPPPCAAFECCIVKTLD
jgi:hypothetical protein